MADMNISTLEDARTKCPAIWAQAPAEHVSAGYTFACANQAVVGDTLGSFRISHLRATIEEILDGIASLVSRVPEVYASLQAWQSLEVPSDVIAQYRHTALKLRYPTDNPDAPEVGMNFGRAQRREDVGFSLYNLYQRTQESLLRGGYDVTNPVTQETRRARPIRGVDANIKVNCGLWDLTSQTAALLAH